MLEPQLQSAIAEHHCCQQVLPKSKEISQQEIRLIYFHQMVK
jgi:hypothetical protein